MKKTTIIGLCLILGLALVATVALAWGPGFGPGFGPRFGPGFRGPAYGVLPIPNLTADQSAKIQALRDEFLKEIGPLQKELYTKGTELRNFWSNPKVDQAAIAAKQKEISNLQSQLQDKAINLGLAIRKILTPEQLAQLPAFGPGGGFGPPAGFGAGRGFGPPVGFGPRW
jgi:Spy/CpxP family protein refolding chaperone